MMIVWFMLGGGALAASIILAVMFAPEERFVSTVSVNGKPLEIEATSCERTEPEKPKHVWDEIDQHWGEAQWMLTAG